MDANYYNRLINLVEDCKTMSEIQYATEQVHEFLDSDENDIDSKHRHQILNILCDETFDVFIKENPKSEPKKVVAKRKPRAKAKVKAKVTTKPKAKKKVTKKKELV